jgi:nucleoside-diphosphate-sugar epimerase
MYIDDCTDGIMRIIQSDDYREPLNLGSDELVTINQLVSMVERIAGVSLKRKYLLDAPLGVRGRNSDNTLLGQTIGWLPSISLERGLEKTYAWIYDEIAKRGAKRSAVSASA